MCDNNLTPRSSLSKEDTSKKWDANVMANVSGMCLVCDKEGNTVITTTKGNKIIPYYVCEKFVNMTPSERLSKLKSKNLCTKFLFYVLLLSPILRTRGGGGGGGIPYFTM